MQAVKLPSNRIWLGLPIAHVYGVNDGEGTIQRSRWSRVELVFETRSGR